jgi:hypothetical protein
LPLRQSKVGPLGILERVDDEAFVARCEVEGKDEAGPYAKTWNRSGLFDDDGVSVDAFPRIRPCIHRFYYVRGFFTHAAKWFCQLG